MTQGLQAAMHVGATEIAVFTAASEQFCKKNTNCSIEDSMRRIQDVIQAAKKKDIAVRGYVSCVVGCPYQVSVLHMCTLLPAIVPIALMNCQNFSLLSSLAQNG